MGDNTKEDEILREKARQSVQSYFAHLDGEEPCNVYQMVLSQVEQPLLELTMAYTKNNQSKACKILGINRGTLRKKLRLYNLI